MRKTEEKLPLSARRSQPQAARICARSRRMRKKKQNVENKKAFYFRGKRLYTLFAESLYRKGEKFYGTDSAKGQRKKNRGNRCERDSVDFRGVLRVCHRCGGFGKFQREKRNGNRRKMLFKRTFRFDERGKARGRA